MTREERKNAIYSKLQANGFIIEKTARIDKYFLAVQKSMPKPVGNDKPTLRQIETITNWLENRGEELSEELREFLATCHKYLKFNQYSYLVGVCMDIWSTPTDNQRRLCREMLKCPLIKNDMAKEMTSKMSYRDVSELINRYYPTFQAWKKVTPEMRSRVWDVLVNITFGNVTEQNAKFINMMTIEDYQSFMDAYKGDFAHWVKSADEHTESERQERYSQMSLRNDKNEYYDSFNFKEFCTESKTDKIEDIWTLL